MAGFRRIDLSLLLTLLLQFTAAIGGFPLNFVVRDGGEVTLPCENVIADQDGCNRIDWIVIAQNTEGTALVKSGQIIQRGRGQSGRLSVTESCALLIKRVTAEDVGFYVCRQNRLDQILSGVAQLSLVTMTEQTDGDRVTLNCSVSPYGTCLHTVRWLHEDTGIDTETSHADCSVTLTFPATHLQLKDREVFKCEVNHTYDGQTRQFSYSPQSPEFVTSVPGKDPKAETESTSPTSATTSLTKMSSAKPAVRKTSPTETTDSTAKPTLAARAGCSALDYMMLVTRVAEILLMTVITVLLFRAQGRQRAADDTTVHHGGGGHDGAVNYENVGEPSASVRLR